MNNLYDNFARVIKSLSSESAAAAIVADQYAVMTYLEESEPSSFMFCESNTWKLISLLADKNKSELQQYATVRQWISKVPNDKVLLNKIHEKKLIEEELEEELNFIVRKNRILRSHEDERPNKLRRKNNDAVTEELCREKYNTVRGGELIQVNDYKPLAYLYNEYVKYGQYALLDSQATQYINLKERLTWRDCVKHIAKDEALGRYEKALYNALAGNAIGLYKTECQTWEDVIWAYLNEHVENTIDTQDHTKLNDLNHALLDTTIISLALEKDEIMEKDDPRILFHQIQSAILSNTTQQLMERLHDGYVSNNWDTKLCINDQHRAQALRFISTWILFGRQYLGWKEDDTTTALLSAYTELNAQPATFRPVVIASYAAKLSPNDQIRVFSDFLENFDGDGEESIVISKLGKEYGLDVPNILKVTSTNILKKAFDTVKPVTSKTFDINPGSDEEDYDLFFRAMHWLLIDDNLALTAVQSANTIIRFFYTHRKIYLVKKMFDLIPQSIYDRLMLEYDMGGEQAKAIDEFDLHRKVMLIFTKYKDWESLIHAKPKDSGSLDDLQAIYNWRDEAERQTITMENNIRSVLEGRWLKDGSIKAQNSNEVATRKLYIPEILIRYNNLLRLSVDVIEKNKGKSLIKYVTVEHRDLFDDITSSRRWEDVLDEFSKSLAEV